MARHLLLDSARETFEKARAGLGDVFCVVDAHPHNVGGLRLALAAVAYACDALKAAANAYANVLSAVQREGKS